jgi:hypothetical protein
MHYFFEVARISISVDFLLLLGPKRRSNYVCATTSDFLKCMCSCSNGSIMHIFFEVARISISVDIFFAITRSETALQLCVLNPKLFHKGFKGKREPFSCLPHKTQVSSCLKFQLCTIFRGRTDRHFRYFLLLLGSKRRSNYVCATPNYAISFIKGMREPFLVSNLKCMCPRAQKVQLCTILGGQAHRHFRGFFGHYSGRNGAANMYVQCLCSATMCHQGYQRAALTIFLPVMYKSWVLVLKRINYAPFFELTRILISVPSRP